MSFPRVRIRTVMIAVAVLGTLLGIAIEARRQYWIYHYRRLLRQDEEVIPWLDGLARKARQSEANGEPPIGRRTWGETIDLYERLAGHQREWASYRRRMIRRYGGDPDSR